MTEIVFLPAHDNKTKIQKICETVQDHFLKQERLFIIVSNDEAVKYLDQLFWRFSEESFLPHSTVFNSTDKIFILKDFSECIDIKNVFNLCSQPVVKASHLDLVYELYDKTSQEKYEHSEKRMEFYQKEKYCILLR